MALSKATLDAITAAVAAALAQAPAQATAKSPVKARANTFAADVIAGQHVCTADPSCGRVLRTAKRAAVHGIAAGGHAPKA